MKDTEDMRLRRGAEAAAQSVRALVGQLAQAQPPRA